LNLSINSTNKELARKLSGTNFYDVDKTIELAKFISKTKMSLLLAPVWVPGWNDDGIIEIIKLGKKLNAKLGIQKYEKHKFGRKPKKVKQVNYYKFYKELERLEKKYNVKLKLGPAYFNIEKRKRLPKVFNKGDKISAIVKCDGWYKEQKIAVAKNRCITVNNCNKTLNKRINVKIIETANNLYIGKLNN
jgi:hypothetical protein